MRVGRISIALFTVLIATACAERPGERPELVVLTRDSSLVAVRLDGASTHLMDGVEFFSIAGDEIVATGRTGLGDRKLGTRSTYRFPVENLARFVRAEASAEMAAGATNAGDQPDARFKVAGDTIRWSGPDGATHEVASVKSFRVVPAK